MPVIHFYPEYQDCPECDFRLHVQKTADPKTVVTNDIGAFIAKETVGICPRGHGTFKSGLLRSLVPKNCTFGFDIIVEVGFSLFVHSRSNQEIMAALATKNVFLSEREVSYLGRKFIIYLALAHRQSQAVLKEYLADRGGYILHVDGTCEGNSPNLFCGLDGLSELVLDSVKISSEKKDQLIPFFRDIKDRFGEPRALVHDMGKGILNAVAEVFPDTPDYICHFHFLRDIGKDLLLSDYTAFYKRLRKLKVRPTLKQRGRYLEQKVNPESHDIDGIAEIFQQGDLHSIDFEPISDIIVYMLIKWIFEYPSQSRGYGFPFDRPHLDFYRRLQEAYQILGKFKDADMTQKAKKPVIQIYKVLADFAEDQRLNDLAKDLETKSAVFDKLRGAMRIALPDGKDGINDNGDCSDMKTIKERVTAFRKWLPRNKHREKTYAGMIKQIDKYWEKLFADPIAIQTPQGTITVQPQRTNNILERFFRNEKRRGRKKTGTASLNRMLKSILANTPLVQNLKNEEYLKIILNGCSSLEERFSQIDARLVQQELASSTQNKDKILPAIKKMIKDVKFTEKISKLICPC
ncbi:MAG: transposase [Desulfobacteraceae bacterium]|nr:transposase [Desulfobacteraceae bacterium]